MTTFFSREEISLIKERLKNLQIMHVVFCSFESRFAKSGGLSSVISNILPYIKETSEVQDVALLSPFYPGIIPSNKLKSSGIAFDVQLGRRSVKTEILEYNYNYSQPRKGTVKEFYLKAKGFFDAKNSLRDPYLYDKNDREANFQRLRENALFYCRAVPMALKALDIREDAVLHLHEWQTALCSLTVKEAMINGTIKSCGSIQTMHNSYDAPLEPANLSAILDLSRRKKMKGMPERLYSAYQIGLKVTDAPVTTVSEHFASELTTDIIQTKYYAPHVQSTLKKCTVHGVNNGMFMDFSPEFPRREKHSINEIQKIKLKNRKTLLKFLSTYRPKERFGDLTFQGKTILKLPDEIPIAVMTGRLDPTQKGYYVFLRAIERFVEDELKVVLAPMPVNTADLDYFYEVACKCRGNVTVYPLRMEKGYNEIQTGATFGVMPSVYEPFGAAVEYMAKGTVNIGRATGGLVDQIDRGCGFLYREDAVFYTPENVNDFIETSDVVQARKTNPWAQNMADSLYKVLRRAISTYQNKPDNYYRMIRKGFEKAGMFTWDRAAKKYFNIYKMIRKA
jgi:glycogen synthase